MGGKLDLDKLLRPSFKVGEIIRHKTTGHPYRVIHIYKSYGTILIDLFDSSPLATTLTLKPSHYDQFACDRDMELIKEKEWIFNPITL